MALPFVNFNNFDIISSLGTTNDWNANVPQQSRDDFAANGLAISRAQFEPTWNNVLSTLLNKIAKTVIQNSIMNDPLSQFRVGDFGMLGDTMEQIYVGLCPAQTYEPSWEAGTPFKTSKPNVDSMFHRNPRREVFKQTLYRDDLAKAFRTENGLSTLLNTIIGSMTQSNIASQFIWTKQTLLRYIMNPDVPHTPLQTRMVDLPVDQVTADNFILAVRQAIMDLQFNATLYNPMQAATFTAERDMVLIIWKNIIPTLQVKTWAHVFNLDEMTLRAPVINIDNFGGPTNCIAMLCDRQFFMIMNQALRFEQIWNPEKLYWNMFLHCWEQYSASYFHNVILFRSNQTVPFRASGIEEIITPGEGV